MYLFSSMLPLSYFQNSLDKKKYNEASLFMRNSKLLPVYLYKKKLINGNLSIIFPKFHMFGQIKISKQSKQFHIGYNYSPLRYV